MNPPAAFMPLARETEQAIMLAFLEMPAFRRRAGLPPRSGGSTFAEMGRVLGMSRQSMERITRQALAKLRKATENHEIQ